MNHILMQRKEALTADMEGLKQARASQEQLLSRITQSILETQGALAEIDRIVAAVAKEGPPTKSAEDMPF